MRRRLVRSLAAAALIVAVGVLLGLLANMASHSAVPLLQLDLPPVGGVTLDEARRAQAAGGTAFLDARIPELYLGGHITGAVNLPPADRDVRLEELRRELPRSRPVIVYCDGGSCESAARLADWLARHGWRDVDVLGDGYPAWAAAGFPTRSGGRP